MNLLLFNLATDADDPILGFTTEWINRLAASFEHVDVITMRAGRLAVAPNVRVYSVGKERGDGEARRAVEFYRLLARLLRERTYAACFAHMMPLFAVMGAPLLRARGIPITLWYTHRQAHRTLRWATAVSCRVVTAAPDSFPLPTDKLRVIGHGIDTEFFSPADVGGGGKPAPADGCTIVHVARLMPIKHQATLIRALAQVPDARAVFVGDVPAGQEGYAGYADSLKALADELGVADRVTFAGGLLAPDVRDAYRKASVAVNLSPPGLFDKAALESMATGVPTVVSTHAFDALLGPEPSRVRIHGPEDADGLAARLRDLLALSPNDARVLGLTQRERVVEAHSLSQLMPRLVRLFETGEP